MASKDEQKKKGGVPTWATALIVMVILAILGAVGYYFYTKKGSANGNAAGRNIGTPAPVGNAAVMSMPSPTNVSAGNGAGAGNNAATGRVGAQV